MKKNRKLRLRRLAARTAARKMAKDEIRKGIIKITAGGYGFCISEEDPDNDFFIPAKYVGNALDNDLVKIKLLPPRQGHPEDAERGPVGKVIGIIERKRDSIVGELLDGSFIQPLDPRLPDVIPIRGSRNGAKKGDWVKIKCENDPHGDLTGSIREVIGRSGIISADLDAVMSEFDLPDKYSETDENEAMAVVPEEISRKDCRDLFVLTIDPFDAKDFDDALSVSENGDGSFTVGIHIADVAAFIRPGSKFDKMAKLRAFSCYLPGRTLPMLPAALTAKISMQQGNDSLSHSVFLTVSKDGKILDGRRMHTLIKVDARLDYDEVQKFLDSGTCGDSWDEKTASTLTMLADVVKKMRQYRDRTEKFIDLPLPEIRVVCDEKNNTVSGLEKRFSRPSEQLVEECMLAANQFVGLSLPQKSIAGIYRIHPAPEAEKTMLFSDMMHENFNLACGDISDRDHCREFIASLPDDNNKPLILGMLLRSMTRASYAVKGEEHFALGKTFYAHFTSPIRRYTDLTLHQQLWEADKNNRTRNASALEGIAAYCSETEERIDGASARANERLKIRILEAEVEQNPEKIFSGVVVRILNNGVQVEITEYGLTGFAPFSKMSTPQHALKIGSEINVMLFDIDRTSIFFREKRERKG